MEERRVGKIYVSGEEMTVEKEPDFQPYVGQ